MWRCTLRECKRLQRICGLCTYWWTCSTSNFSLESNKTMLSSPLSRITLSRLSSLYSIKYPHCSYPTTLYPSLPNNTCRYPRPLQSCMWEAKSKSKTARKKLCSVSLRTSNVFDHVRSFCSYAHISTALVSLLISLISPCSQIPYQFDSTSLDPNLF